LQAEFTPAAVKHVETQGRGGGNAFINFASFNYYIAKKGKNGISVRHGTLSFPSSGSPPVIQ
jgi:hypothetical protein